VLEDPTADRAPFLLTLDPATWVLVPLVEMLELPANGPWPMVGLAKGSLPSLLEVSLVLTSFSLSSTLALVAEELCLELAKGVLPVLEEIVDPALLLFCLEKAKGVLEDPTADRAPFLLTLDPATWVLVPLVEMLELPANGPWPMVGLAKGSLPSLLEVSLVLTSSSLSSTLATILTCSSVLRPTGKSHFSMAMMLPSGSMR